jgi:cytochrome c biogenesis protein CcmG, thiol:disulfide interchange protein DsbE
MWKKIILGIVIVLVAGGAFLFKQISAPQDMAKARAMESQAAPNLSLTTYPGKEQIELQSLVGKKPIYLNFWATWCPPCIGEMPHMNELYAQYKDKLEFVIVSVDNDAADVDKFISAKQYSLPIYTVDNQAAAKAYDIQGIPASIIIGTDGKVKTVHVGSMSKAEMQQFFDSAL